jgi:hypothetical protein
MSRILEGLFGNKGLSKKEVSSFLKKQGKAQTVCYVLITCSQPKKDGTMDVEMKYEGDKYLASYMIETASKIIERE